MKKYLLGKDVTEEDAALIVELQKQFETKFLYSSKYHKDLWFSKVEAQDDELSVTLFKLHKKAKKYKIALHNAICAYGYRLYVK